MTEPRHRLSAALLTAVIVTGATPGIASADHQHATAKTWTEQPLLLPARGFSRSLQLLKPQGLAVDGALVLPSVDRDEDAAISRVPLREGKLAVRALGPRQGGYYRVTALQQDGDDMRIAGTVVYFSNPGPAPRDMLAQTVMPLEIVPDRLPREHRHYRAGETWAFRLRAEGRPLTGHRVLFESAQNSQELLYTDDQGRVRVTFPDDFPVPQTDGDHGSHRGGPRSDFVLSAHWRDGQGRRLLSAFNGDYRPGAYADRNLWLGGGFALLGMLVATPLLRRRQAGEVAR